MGTLSIISQPQASAASDDDFVPSNNNVMVEYYAKFVQRLLTRHNKVQGNFEDICQHVWMELIRVDILKKYAVSGRDALPKTMTATQACEFLGVSWGQWRTLMWYGQPNAEKSHPTHFRRHHGKITPVPTEGGWSSKKAVFSTDDIVRLHETGYFLKRSSFELNLPIGRTRSKFRVYLATAVHNIFANWCRTRSRRYKDQYLAPREDGSAWESAIADEEKTTASIDVQISVSEAISKVFDGDPDKGMRVMSMLGAGYVLTEIAKEMNLPHKIVEGVRKAVLDQGRFESITPAARMLVA